MTALHPDIVKVAAMLREAGLSPPSGGSVQDIRDYLDRIAQLTAKDSKPLDTELVVEFPVNGRQVPCKLYLPDQADRPPLMVYCHGGGFRHGTLAGWDAPLRQLVRGSGAAALSIEYALSPEYTFPRALEEIVFILTHLAHSGSVGHHEFAGLALGGDSAGANLALSAALTLRDKDMNALRYLLLFYGVYSKDVRSDSWQRFSGYAGHGLSSDSMSRYWQTYLENDESDWRVQPLHADPRGLPQTRIVVGEFDPLIDQNVALAEKLKTSDVPVSLEVLPDIIHGFIRFNEVAPVVHHVLEAEAAGLRTAMQEMP